MEPEMRKQLSTAEQWYDWKVKELEDERRWTKELEIRLLEVEKLWEKVDEFGWIKQQLDSAEERARMKFQ